MQEATSFAGRLRTFAADIKLSHSVFALPFALLAAVLAGGGAGATVDRYPTWVQIGLIVVCMVCARSFAMGMNRLLDARFDAMNPRTARRAIPAGRLSPRFVTGACVTTALLFILATAGFGWADANWLPLVLAMPALGFIGLYPLLKRYTRWVHFYLGAALGIAPLCAWIAIAGRIEFTPVLLGLGVMFWTGGFDILYAAQDVEVDREQKLFSIPARFGVAGGLWISRVAHLICIAIFVSAGVVNPQLDTLWFVGISAAALLLIYEQSIVRPNDLSRLNLAFFTLNGCVSLVLGTLGVIDAVAM
jgi:4-hydroxybenzoate polyprenyltransferase